MITVCKRCDHHYMGSKSEPYWRWLCTAAPLDAWDNFVTGETVADPPYQFCKEINRYGNCPMYEPLKMFPTKETVEIPE